MKFIKISSAQKNSPAYLKIYHQVHFVLKEEAKSYAVIIEILLHVYH
jgi:hypothetical protein